MKYFLQNLLIFFSLCLCGLIAFQWVRETDLNKRLQKLTDAVRDRDISIQNLNAKLRVDEEEIKRLDAIKTQLTATVNSNTLQIAQLTKDLDKAEGENERNLKQIEVYKETLKTANENIRQANEKEVYYFARIGFNSNCDGINAMNGAAKCLD